MKGRGSGGQDQGTSSLVKNRSAEGPTLSKTKEPKTKGWGTRESSRGSVCAPPARIIGQRKGARRRGSRLFRGSCCRRRRPVGGHQRGHLQCALGDESWRRGCGQDQSTGPLVKRHIGPNTNFSGTIYQELATCCQTNLVRRLLPSRRRYAQNIASHNAVSDRRKETTQFLEASAAYRGRSPRLLLRQSR
jgi:hypothetical protein